MARSGRIAAGISLLKVSYSPTPWIQTSRRTNHGRGYQENGHERRSG